MSKKLITLIMSEFLFVGTRAHANRYIQQFTEIFTEEGRKSVRIKHLVPGQLPRVSYTAGMREMVVVYYDSILIFILWYLCDNI